MEVRQSHNSLIVVRQFNYYMSVNRMSNAVIIINATSKNPKPRERESETSVCVGKDPLNIPDFKFFRMIAFECDSSRIGRAPIVEEGSTQPQQT